MTGAGGYLIERGKQMAKAKKETEIDFAYTEDNYGEWRTAESKANKIAEKICREHGVKLEDMDIGSYEFCPHGFMVRNIINLPKSQDMDKVRVAIDKKGVVTKTRTYPNGYTCAEEIRIDIAKALLPHIKRHKKAKAQMAKLIAKAKKTGKPQLLESYMDECGERDCSQDAVSRYVDGNGKIIVHRLHTY